MIEAVGYDFWDDYFRILDRVLAPGGRVGIQAITMRHDRMLASRDTYTWINKYIFPGGFLPSVEVIDRITRRPHHACGSATGCRSAPHYAETLRQWDERFLAARARVLGARLRRHVRADVALLPRLLAGRLRLRLPRRQPDRARPGRPGMTAVAPGRRTASVGVAATLAEAAEPFVGGDLPVRLRAWDGTEAGPADAPLVELRSPDAVRRLLWHPGELGAAQAYVTGELDVAGDLDAGADPRGHGRPGARRDRAASGAAALARGVRAAPTAGRGRPPAARRRRRRPASAAGCTARCATGRRSATTTTSPTSSTRWSSTRSMAYSCAYYADDPEHAVERRAARQARPGLRASSASGPGSGCSTSAAAGARCRCTRPSTTAPRSSA